MTIRKKLTLQFLVFTAVIMLASSVAIYVFSTNYRRDDFYRRLFSKAENTSKLLIEVDEIDINLLRRIERDNPMSMPNEKIIIFDYQNHVLFSTDDASTIHYNNELLDKIKEEKELKFRQDKYEVLGYLFRGKNNQFVVLAAATDIHGHSKIKNLQQILTTVDVLSLILLLCAGWIYSGRALKPIAKIIEDVTKISARNLDMRLNEGRRKDELELLAHTFNKMISNLEVAFKAQKHFIANASHELRTPLTAITGQIEYILMQNRPAEEVDSVLASIYDDIKNLNRLSDRLLLLAHTDPEMLHNQKQDFRIDEALWQAQEDLIKANPGYKAEILMNDSLNDENMTIRGDEHLMKTAFLNLMENGCKYSSLQSVSVKLDILTDNQIQVQFVDQGIGIPEDELKQITKPFYRGSNSLPYKGNGIGLSIVERIVKIHGGTFEIISELGKGTEVSIHIPLTAS